ncbi:MAG: HEAT repeat domain-containing protein [Planctomycetota bacterium]|jgi:HEAT repeat protein
MEKHPFEERPPRLASVASLVLLAAAGFACPPGEAAESAALGLIAQLKVELDRGEDLHLWEIVWKIQRVDAGELAVPVLIEALGTVDTAWRSDVVRSLGDLGPDAAAAADHLLALITDERLAYHASVALAEIGPPVVPKIVSALGNEDPAVRAGAAFVLNHLGRRAKAAVPAMIRPLKDDDPIVRRAIAGALGKAGRTADAFKVANALIGVLQDEDFVVRAGAAESLGLLGPAAQAAVPQLSLLLMTDEETWPQSASAEALGRIGPAATTQLIIALGHPEAEVRCLAAKALVRIGPDAKLANAALIRCLEDDDPAVRVRAAFALWTIDGQLDRAMPVLIDGLKGEAGWAAADLIARLGPAAKDAVPALVEIARAGDSRAIHALVRIGPEAEETVPAILQALVMYAAVGGVPGETYDALWRIGKPALPALVQTLQHPKERVRQVAAEILGNMRSQADAAIPALIEALTDESNVVREAAREALEDIAMPWGPTPDVLEAVDNNENRRLAVAALLGVEAAEVKKRLLDEARTILAEHIDRLDDSDGMTRAWAAGALGPLGPLAAPALPKLRKMLRDEDVHARIEAAAALWQITGDSDAALPVLIEELNDPYEDVRRGAAHALSSMGPDAETAAPALLRLLQDDQPHVRIAAAEALWKVSPGHDAVVPALTGLLDEGVFQYNDPSAAALALAEIGSPAKAAVPELRKVLATTDWDDLVDDVADALAAIAEE